MVLRRLQLCPEKQEVLLYVVANGNSEEVRKQNRRTCMVFYEADKW